MFILIIVFVSFAFFTQSLLGFGGGLICIPLLSLFMPVKDAASMVMIYQLSMGILIFSTYKDIQWQPLLKIFPAMIVGVVVGIFMLNSLDGDVLRGILAGYIALHLARKHTSFDPLGRLIKWGDVHLAGFFGGLLNAMIGGGAPAFIIYLKDHVVESSAFRASMIAVLMVSNVPRAFGVVGTGMLSWDLFLTGMYAFPFFLCAVYGGHKMHGRIAQDRFFRAVDVLLVFSAVMLIIKVML